MRGAGARDRARNRAEKRRADRTGMNGTEQRGADRDGSGRRRCPGRHGQDCHARRDHSDTARDAMHSPTCFPPVFNRQAQCRGSAEALGFGRSGRLGSQKGREERCGFIWRGRAE